MPTPYQCSRIVLLPSELKMVFNDNHVSHVSSSIVSATAELTVASSVNSGLAAVKKSEIA
jgi:hypothetical protein